jgi:hypothetical protein
MLSLIIVQNRSFAQCNVNTTVFSDGFGAGGDGTDCFAGSSIVNNTTTNMTMTANPRANNGSSEPGDGEYSIICDGAGSGFDGFWLWHNTLTDHTTGDVNGNMVVINDGDNTDFYKKTLTGLCPSKTYTVTFYLANLADWDLGTGSCGARDKYPIISASAVGTTTNTTTTYGTLATTSDLTWSGYTFTFTTGASETSMDVILYDTETAGCGNDLVFDDFKVVGPLSGLPIKLNSFKAFYTSENTAELLWESNGKEDCKFDIYGSENGVDFVLLNTLNAQQNMGQYSYQHEFAGYNSIHYFKVKEYTTDYSNWSNVVYADRRGYSTSKIVLFPNPVNTNSVLTIYSASTINKIEILDLNGKLLNTIQTNEGSTINLNIGDLSKGLYFAKIETADGVLHEKLIVE